jgi:hypothetical protein
LFWGQRVIDFRDLDLRRKSGGKDEVAKKNKGDDVSAIFYHSISIAHYEPKVKLSFQSFYCFFLYLVDVSQNIFDADAG